MHKNSLLVVAALTALTIIGTGCAAENDGFYYQIIDHDVDRNATTPWNIHIHLLPVNVVATAPAGLVINYVAQQYGATKDQAYYAGLATTMIYSLGGRCLQSKWNAEPVNLPSLAVQLCWDSAGYAVGHAAVNKYLASVEKKKVQNQAIKQPNSDNVPVRMTRVHELTTDAKSLLFTQVNKSSSQ